MRNEQKNTTAAETKQPNSLGISLKQTAYQVTSAPPRRWRLFRALQLREGITHESDSLERAGASHAQEFRVSWKFFESCVRDFVRPFASQNDSGDHHFEP